MASILKVDSLTGVTTAGSISVTGEGNSTTTNLQQGLCKSWVNFDGQSTPAARDSFNHASLTDNGTGDYTPAFTSSFGNVNYSCSAFNFGNTTVDTNSRQFGSNTKATSNIRIRAGYGPGTNGGLTLYDSQGHDMNFMGDLA